VAQGQDAGIEDPDSDHQPIAARQVYIVDAENPRRAETALKPMPTIIAGVFLAVITAIMRTMVGVAVTMVMRHSFQAHKLKAALLTGIRIRFHITESSLQWLGSDGQNQKQDQALHAGILNC
jgi:hypothetical protein